MSSAKVILCDDCSPSDAFVLVRARINLVASTIARRHDSLPRARTLNTSVRHVPQAQRCLSRNATQFKGHATVGTKR